MRQTKQKKSLGPPLKSTLFNTILPELKQQSFYFSIKAVQRVLGEHSIHVADQTLRKYLSQAMTMGIVNDAGYGWYSSIAKPFVLNADPILKFVKKVKDKFPLLDFSCWSTQQINSFTHHMLAKFVTFIYVDQDALFSVRDWMRHEGFEVYVSPGKAEIEKNFEVGENTVVIRRGCFKETKKGSHLAPIEKILVDLLIEAPKLYLMDDSEAEGVIEKTLESGRINIAVLFSYARQHRANISFLNNISLFSAQKLILHSK
ncbi:MAG: hypothetical protein HQM16_12965 [Deltaproteobacteria bacterium]|nr:hypothetical protein [Deltaproteobacteria bacterium]